MTRITRIGLAAAFALVATMLAVLLTLLAACWGVVPASVLSTLTGFALVLLLPDV